MMKVMQKLNLPIEVWKLVRHVTIDGRIASKSRILLTVSGVEPDGTPASILSQVRVRNAFKLLSKRATTVYSYSFCRYLRQFLFRYDQSR